MTNRLVQQNPWPSRSQHHFHLTRRSIHRVELNDRLSRRLFRKVFWSMLRQEVLQRDPSAAARRSARRLIARLRDTENV